MARPDGIDWKISGTPPRNAFRRTECFFDGLLREVFEPEKTTPEQTGRHLPPLRRVASQGYFERECPQKHTALTQAPSTMIREIGPPPNASQAGPQNHILYVYYPMGIGFDPSKAQGNLKKHGVGLSDSEPVLYDPRALTREDDSSDTEQRFISVGMDALGRILTVVWTEGRKISGLFPQEKHRKEKGQL